MSARAEKPFWIVWSPDGPTSPRHQHANRLAAETEAQRMAAVHPGREFFVMAAVMSARKADLVIRRFEYDDGIPF